ncbi:MAG: glutamate--tRNA ligase [Candidatus Wildermuthbacteria bacterium]|nr:glutamate--tRNA ligase [Candidatus Wildermuthbacteria bacterium]
MEIRTRFAPSPTGFLHIGSARTALFSYLFAKKNQGSFILRIEDTDIERSKPEYEKDIIESLKWLGIEWDEGPDDIDGAYGPYRQSERLNIYKRYLEKLLEENKAYYCFCSEEELEDQRQYQLSIGEAPRYNGKCAQLSKEEAQERISAGNPSVIRFGVPIKKVKFNDIIRGQIEFDSGLIGDTVIAKNLNAPLYNFSVVIDDFEMKISHVIRGEEHLSNTPRQILLQEALGIPQPKYAHLPLILAPDRSKLSKRHGSASVADYKKEGYLPEAIINFLAFLGWNPGGEKEIYPLEELAKEFSLERVQKGGAIFNIQRLDYLNGFYIRQLPIEKLAELCLPYLGKITDVNTNYLPKIISICKDRLKKLSEITEFTDFFFGDIKYDRGLLKWKNMSDEEIKQSLEKSEKLLSEIKPEEWTKENLEKCLMPEAEKGSDRGQLLWPLRVALTGQKTSAGPFEIAGVLGKEKTLSRISQAKSKLASRREMRLSSSSSPRKAGLDR